MRKFFFVVVLLFLPACLEECSGLRSPPPDCAQCARACDDLCAPVVGLARCGEGGSCECACEYPDAAVEDAPDVGLDAGQVFPDAAFCQFYSDAC